jgi:hypothetical protein
LRTLGLSWINTLSNPPSWLLPLPSLLPQLPPSTFVNPPPRPEQRGINESHREDKRHSSHHHSTDRDLLHPSNQTKEWVCPLLPNLPPHPHHQEELTVNDLYLTPMLNLNLSKSNMQSHDQHPSHLPWIRSQSRTSILHTFNFRNNNLRWLAQLLRMGF